MNQEMPHFVAVGASGPEGLRDIIGLLRELPKPVGAIVMVVLHRPSDRISHLREVLGRACDIPLIIAEEAECLAAGNCYIGEPDGHLTLVDRHIAHLVPGAGHRLRNRSIDTLFNSLAAHAGRRVIGIVLSGGLDDGSRGLAAIHAAGGVTMVLDPGLKPRGMQQNAIDHDGPIGFIGTIAGIAARVGQILASVA
jgi:chemotaxis response regulator CheB